MRGVRCVGGAEVILPDVRTLLMPGVRSAATVFTVPMSGFAMAARATRRRGASAFEKRSLGVVEFITADHFRSIGSPCGAVPSSRRRLRCLPQVTIISEGFARKLWPEFPKVIGLHLLININTTRVEIVGDIR
jgi:hypothetical protein